MNTQLLVQATQSSAGASPYSAPAIETELAPATRRALAFAAALLVNLGVLGVLQWSAANARYAPAGEVVITQLEAPLPARLAKN